MSVLTLFLLGCNPLLPEAGIDNTTISGMVLVAPTLVAEEGETNNRETAAVTLGEIAYSTLVYDANMARLSVDEEGEPTGDADWNLITVSEEVAGSITLELVDPDAGVRLELFNVDERVPVGLTGDAPTLLASADLVGSGSLAVSLEPGINYGVVITGITEGTSEQSAYRVVFPSLHPDDAGILVGAYQSNDPSDRGFPIAGSPVRQFTRLSAQLDAIGRFGDVAAGAPAADQELPQYTWAAAYEMLFVKTVSTDEEGNTVVDEDVEGPAFVFAGAFANLNQGLPAGTFYSASPIEIALESDQIVVDPVLLDAYAPLVVGFEAAEVEPNDMEFTDSSGIDLTTGEANDLGLLSGPGFVDIITGTNPLSSTESAWGIHDHDVFGFQVPVPLTMLFTLEWQNEADIDLLFYDSTGEAPLDGAATFDNPEVGGGEMLFEPGEQYYLLVLGYSGDPDDPPEYELRLEQIGAR